VEGFKNVSKITSTINSIVLHDNFCASSNYLVAKKDWVMPSRSNSQVKPRTILQKRIEKFIEENKRDRP
jgi:hypothetical protein